MTRRTIGVSGLCCAGVALLAACSTMPAPQTPVRTVTATATTTAPSPTGASGSAATKPPSTGPGRVFDATVMQADIAKILTGTYKLKDVGAVTCPPGQAVRDATAFSCTVSVGGKEKQIPITVTGDDGQYQVGAPG
ncbi:DUF4333 domain-containing protein [Amycolatopsis sp. H20-H5]|uniref:DUF4333 domain-containing protein n=1 Tax=Amycolatopsis sp. H20-H5 TaxID=3046309 RepID=UPI002DB6FCA8|nr:DUF4333 domain-containing protein [Amycolatopsis sp. H20-H5]MEC3979361.1 DUF4333 domain-containing protein [Amycolatopsis sp. H20-H5]